MTLDAPTLKGIADRIERARKNDDKTIEIGVDTLEALLNSFLLSRKPPKS